MVVWNPNGNGYLSKCNSNATGLFDESAGWFLHGCTIHKRWKLSVLVCRWKKFFPINGVAQWHHPVQRLSFDPRTDHNRMGLTVVSISMVQIFFRQRDWMLSISTFLTCTLQSVIVFYPVDATLMVWSFGNPTGKKRHVESVRRRSGPSSRSWALLMRLTRINCMVLPRFRDGTFSHSDKSQTESRARTVGHVDLKDRPF